MNSNLNVKTYFVDFDKVDDEVNYYNQYNTIRKNIHKFIETKKAVFDSEYQEKKITISQLEKELQKREEENLSILNKINDLNKIDAEIFEGINRNKEEIVKKFDGICQKRREIWNLFENRLNDLKKKEKSVDHIIKELYLYMNILKLRIINIDDLQNGATVLKAYHIQKDNYLKYIEIDLNEDENIRFKRFSEMLEESLFDTEETKKKEYTIN
jgi:hypothetical protein